MAMRKRMPSRGIPFAERLFVLSFSSSFFDLFSSEMDSLDPLVSEWLVFVRNRVQHAVSFM